MYAAGDAGATKGHSKNKLIVISSCCWGTGLTQFSHRFSPPRNLVTSPVSIAEITIIRREVAINFSFGSILNFLLTVQYVEHCGHDEDHVSWYNYSTELLYMIDPSFLYYRIIWVSDWSVRMACATSSFIQSRVVQNISPSWTLRSFVLLMQSDLTTVLSVFSLQGCRRSFLVSLEGLPIQRLRAHFRERSLPHCEACALPSI